MCKYKRRLFNTWRRTKRVEKRVRDRVPPLSTPNISPRPEENVHKVASFGTASPPPFELVHKNPFSLSLCLSFFIRGGVVVVFRSFFLSFFHSFFFFDLKIGVTKKSSVFNRLDESP